MPFVVLGPPSLGLLAIHLGLPVELYSTVFGSIGGFAVVGAFCIALGSGAFVFEAELVSVAGTAVGLYGTVLVLQAYTFAVSARACRLSPLLYAGARFTDGVGTAPYGTVVVGTF